MDWLYQLDPSAPDPVSGVTPPITWLLTRLPPEYGKRWLPAPLGCPVSALDRLHVLVGGVTVGRVKVLEIHEDVLNQRLLLWFETEFVDHTAASPGQLWPRLQAWWHRLRSRPFPRIVPHQS